MESTARQRLSPRSIATSVAASLLLLFSSPPGGPRAETTDPAPPPHLRGLSPKGETDLTIAFAFADSAETEPASLDAVPWSMRAPEISIPLFEGREPFAIAEKRGSVIVLDFWASWCAPCVAGLQDLERVFQKEKDRGLEIVAVNIDEPEELATPFGRALGLTMPIGHYDQVQADEFRVKKIPSTIVIDRRGHIRARWDGRGAEHEAEVYERVRALLDEEVGPPPFTVARVLDGAGSYRVDWARRFRDDIDGLILRSSSRGGTEVMFTDRRRVGRLAADGRLIRGMPTSDAVAQIAFSATSDAIGGAGQLIGYRRGSTRVALVTGADQTTWESPSPVFDAVWLGRSDRVLLGTLGGLISVVPDGSEPRTVGKQGTVLEIADAGPAFWAILEPERLVWTDRSFYQVAEASMHGQVLAVRPGERPLALVGSSGVKALAVLADEEGGRAAAALDDGQLVISTLTKPARTVFRADWPGIEHLAAGDLDGDGDDELVVAWGDAIAVLTPVR